jgi:hypothetical protein
MCFYFWMEGATKCGTHFGLATSHDYCGTTTQPFRTYLVHASSGRSWLRQPSQALDWGWMVLPHYGP